MPQQLRALMLDYALRANPTYLRLKGWSASLFVHRIFLFHSSPYSSILPRKPLARRVRIWIAPSNSAGFGVIKVKCWRARVMPV